MSDIEGKTTSEAARELGVAPSTLRYWESELGNNLRIPRNKNGYRQYKEEHIDKLFKIKEYLYDYKYSIKQVREILNMEDSKQEIAAVLLKENKEGISSLLSLLLDKVEKVENGVDELKEGQRNLKAEYLQAIKALTITTERRDRELIKEIRTRLSAKKEKNEKNIIQKLLPWGD
ncbi:MAG: MerR family transcriptional regulator [Halanaerobiales bacterium]